MLRIDYESEGFGAGSGVGNGAASLTVSWNDLLWAAMTVGRPNRHYVFRHGAASWYEVLFRLSLVRMSLEQSSPGARRLRRTLAARTLDPSEKGAVNYFLGLAVAKMFADKCLGAPWLLHLDVFRPQLNVQLAGRSRPDLIGQTPAGDWVALECKGRVSPPSADAKDRAKEQAERVTTVNGDVPVVNAGCVTYFRKEVMQFFWRDPEPDPAHVRNPIGVQVSPDSWRSYYAPVLALFSEVDPASTATQDGVLSVRHEGLDITVSIRPQVLRLLLAGLWAEARATIAEAPGAEVGSAMHADGLGVIAGVSWSKPFDDEGADLR